MTTRHSSRSPLKYNKFLIIKLLCIPQAAIVVIETNLGAPALEYVCTVAHASGVPVLLEPVSVPKAARWATHSNEQEAINLVARHTCAHMEYSKFSSLMAVDVCMFRKPKEATGPFWSLQRATGSACVFELAPFIAGIF